MVVKVEAVPSVVETPAAAVAQGGGDEPIECVICLNELGGVAMTSGNTTEAFADVIRRELAVLPKMALDLGLKMD